MQDGGRRVTPSTGAVGPFSRGRESDQGTSSKAMAPKDEAKSGRGRPKIPDHLKKPRAEYVPTGKPAGRPKKSDAKRGAHLRVPDHLKKGRKARVYVPTGNPKGRPKKAVE